jgi:uncharacterized RDD family membrane protein YckC
MTCSVCGKPYPCVHSGRRTSALLDSDRLQERENEAQESEDRVGFHGSSQRVSVSAEEPGRNPASTAGAETDNWPVEQAWRQEVAARVQQHRAKRRKRSDPNALELDFPADTPISFTAPAEELALPQSFRVEAPATRPEPPKIIRFPRPAVAYTPIVQRTVADDLELADPVWETPRILDTPLEIPEGGPAAPEAEQMELLPSFADIRLDDDESESRARDEDEEDDWLPQPAPLSQRFVAGLVDAGIVFIAMGAFVLTFLKLAEEVPQSRMITLFALAVGGMLWLLFQYVFLVYARTTPGMHMAQLELAAFEGRPASILARRSRALASALSCFSLGLGYAWALVDEDRLGWHDRISQTLVQPAPGIPN